MKQACSPHGWTVDTLEINLSGKIEALDRFCVTSFAQSKERVDMALAASDKAISKAEQATEKRFEGVNEFRATLADQAALLLPRSEFQVQQNAIAEKLSTLTEIVTKLEARLLGKGEGVSGIGTIVLGAIVGLNAVFAIGAVIISIWRH